MTHARRKARRIGPKMRRVIEYVSASPGCAKIGPAWYASPYPGKPLRTCGLGYGYRAVDRAISAGLVAAELHGSRYALTLTDAGRKALDSSQAMP